MISEIIPYHPSLKSFFKDLNTEWLNNYFFVTEEDDKLLSSPEKIIDEGGCIVFAKSGNDIIGTCALVKVSEEEFELAKMAVTGKSQGKGVGRLLLQAMIDEANKRGAKLISLDTASPLKAAISLYKKSGFVQTSVERIHPLFGRKTFRMELKIG